MNKDFTDFNVECFYTEIEEIEVIIKQLFEIEGSLSDKRKEHRKFSESININFNTMEFAYKLYRPSSIIKIYTFVENLVKTYVYSILGNKNNDAITKFIENKIPRDKFVPGTKIDEIKKIIREFTPNSKDLKLFVTIFKYSDSIKSFDNLIVNRHQYAHRGSLEVIYTEKDYRDIVNLLYYLVDELYFCLLNIDLRLKIQSIIQSIYKDLESLKKINNSEGFKNICKNIREVAKSCVKLFNSSKFNFKSEIYIKIEKDLNKLLSLDLRRTMLYNKNYINANLKIFII